MGLWAALDRYVFNGMLPGGVVPFSGDTPAAESQQAATQALAAGGAVSGTGVKGATACMVGKVTPDGFRSLLGRVSGKLYAGRTSAGSTTVRPYPPQARATRAYSGGGDMSIPASYPISSESCVSDNLSTIFLMAPYD
jgi:hypothetical protein